MEYAFLLIIVVSTAAGLAVRPSVSLTAGRRFLAVGLGALVAGLAVFGLMLLGPWPFGIWTGGGALLILLGCSALFLPFGLTVSWGRSAPGSGAA